MNEDLSPKAEERAVPQVEILVICSITATSKVDLLGSQTRVTPVYVT